ASALIVIYKKRLFHGNFFLKRYRNKGSGCLRGSMIQYNRKAKKAAAEGRRIQMTERLTALLSLLAQDSYKPLDELAQKMSLSTKTVRGLLDDLDGQLSGHGAHIERKRGLGYRLDVEDTDKF